MIQATSEGLQLEILGFNITIGTIDCKIVNDYLKPTWYDCLIAFVVNFNGLKENIEVIDDIHTIPLLWENNVFIMKELIQTGYRKYQLEILNHMRISIKAISLADISNS